MPSFFFNLAIVLGPTKVPLEASSQPKAAGSSTPSSIDPPTSTDSQSFKPTVSSALAHDWRYDKILIQDFKMAPPYTMDNKRSRTGQTDPIVNGISVAPGGLATKGRYEPCDSNEQELGWGIVRLYRNADETPGLYDKPITTKHSKSNKIMSKEDLDHNDIKQPFSDEDCTTLCILAVPSYLTPSDFLGFVGEKTREDVSHFRMVRTERGNRYMVLMKFRNGKKAREWRREWNGKAFDAMESERCHVEFIKSIELKPRELPGQEVSFPDMTNDPFTPTVNRSTGSASSNAPLQVSALSPSTSRSSKPMAPPTPSLIEMPTCPVCLERMDESTGLLTILCQHVFHCSCLQKWSGSGCPVCRYTQDGASKRSHHSSSHAEDAGLNECSVCHTELNPWICLICGNIGCGRYDAAHAFAHYKETSHCFSMDMNTQRVWDYASDGYVHRIVQDKTDGKLLEVAPPPDPTQDPHLTNHNANDDDFDDYVPREKLDTIGLEYTHLLTSQMDSQRMYFEEIVERAADKASKASAAAEKATELSTRTVEQLKTLQTAHDTLANETIPALEKERDREARKALKYGEMARKLEKEWREEKTVNESLMVRIQHLGEKVEGLVKEKGELEEQNRDLGFFISGGEKLKGLGGGEEVVEGVVSLPAAADTNGGAGGDGEGGEGKKGRRKGKGKK